MMHQIVYYPEAIDDIEQAFKNYEIKSPGLGERFLNDVTAGLIQIQSQPALYGKISINVRAMVLKRFSFVIYYRFSISNVFIMAVRHGRDDPSIWQSRN
jgi:plasmid stabilization system protein ParE